MPKIKITIYKKDILLDNYMDSDECPITKAINRAIGNGEDTGTLDFSYNKIHVHLTRNNNTSYDKLLNKLFSMYNTIRINNGKNLFDDYSNRIIKPAPVKRFTHVLSWK